ncbi:MAG: hypothetical protein ABSA63_00850 [Thermoplasmata archaeon]|jgi:hypothetical protein
MDDVQFDRSIRFAAYLIGGVLFLVFGAESLISGIIEWAVECNNSNFGQVCAGNQIWQVVSPAIGGAVLVVFAIIFFVMASRSRRSGPAYLPPPPP